MIKLMNAFHILNLRANLFSVRKITENNYHVKFFRDRALVLDNFNNLVLNAIMKDGFYQVIGNENYENHEVCVASMR